MWVWDINPRNRKFGGTKMSEESYDLDMQIKKGNEKARELREMRR